MARPDLIGLSYAKEQLRIDGDADDVWLGLAIRGVSQAVVAWCGGDVARLQDEDGTTRADVVTAVMVEVAYQYENRAAPQAAYIADWYTRGYVLSAGCTAFLQRYHKPVCV